MGKATGGLVQQSISISGGEVYIIKIFANCSYLIIYKKPFRFLLFSNFTKTKMVFAKCSFSITI